MFRRAVDLLDAGDADGLRAHLAMHPGLIQQQVVFEDWNYFRNPTLLEFAAENPIRRGSLPSNIVPVAKVILDAGGKANPASMNSTLGLVCSGSVSRECGMQISLIDLLCDYHADPNSAMLAALAHGEFQAAEALIRRGAQIDMATAAATGRAEQVRKLLPAADGESRHRALALAAQHGHAAVVSLLLEAGEDPNRYNPVGCHAHAMPLHHAALEGHDEVVRLLLDRGARLDIKDLLFHGTPVNWARHGGRTETENYLRAKGGKTARELTPGEEG